MENGGTPLTDAHCHVGRTGSVHRFVCAARRADWTALDAVAVPDVAFYGIHPWYADEWDAAALRGVLEAHPQAGVGEIGLDRLRDRTISDAQRRAFAEQLELAAAFGRPVQLHGAKCWGEVVKACQPHCGRIPAFLFHGFSRSEGLLPDIFALNGFVSVGPALLNDHAVNYRAMVKALPADRILVESDAGAEGTDDVPDFAAVVAKLEEIRGESMAETLAGTAARFLESLR